MFGFFFSFSNTSYTILDNKENFKTGDIEDAVSLDDTYVASECDAEVAEIILGNKMLSSIEQPPTFFCMHKILLEEDAKPVRQPQRRLNPQLIKVVKKEVTKLL